METTQTSQPAQSCGEPVFARYDQGVISTLPPRGLQELWRLGTEGSSHVMRAYELMVIISGDLDENTAHGWLKNISASITSAGGTVHGNPDWWGKRRLAYLINKKSDGFYAVFNILAAGGALDEMERGLRISEDIIRHKLIRLPDHEAQRRGMLAAV